DFEIRDPLTIAEAKIDVDGDYAPDLYGEIVGVVGVVNSINFDATRTSYYIQDATAGINVFGYGVQGVNLNYGDTVHVTGEVDQYKGLTQISISAPEDVELLGAGTSSPEPVLVTLSDMMDPVVAEAHEGLLVKISNVYIVKDAWQSSYGDVAGAITDGTDTLTIRIYAETGIAYEDSSLVFDKLFHFTGIVSQYTYSDPPNDGYQTFPRDISDFEIISSIDEITAIPEVFALQQSYPNPFNPTASIKYDLPREAMVRIIIYDIIGREVRTLVNEKQDAGYKSIIWDGRDNEGCMVTSGMYIYQMITDEFQKTRKMTLLK
ncbi:MAG: T9SS type A sorting domain-containing protein, partial [Candidatus Marinimicrobia bacterium]|nr:T9SS type A sorting domain-containing protein [Candidatus Neomarinimicrobiota bacterium]